MHNSTPDVLVHKFLEIELEELADIIKEDPGTIHLWFNEVGSFQGNYFAVDNSPVHNALDKYQQLLKVADLIKALLEIVGSEQEVIVILTRPRKKFGGHSFATIAKRSPNPLPTDNGLQEMIEKFQAWSQRKGMNLPARLTASKTSRSADKVYEPQQLDKLVRRLTKQGKTAIAAQVVLRQLHNSREITNRAHLVRQQLDYGRKDLIEAENRLAKLQKERAVLEAEQQQYIESKTGEKESARQEYLNAQLKALAENNGT